MPRESPMILIWRAVGFTSLAFGLAGALVPLVPTVPFLLLAAWAFSRGSPRFHAWLVNHPRFGAPIDAWQRHGVIPPRAKAFAVISLVASFTLAALAGLNPWLVVVHGTIVVAVTTFILTRPSRPPVPLTTGD